MREKTRQRVLADTATTDEGLPVMRTRGPERRVYAIGRTPDRRKKQRRKETSMNAENPKVLAPVLQLESTGEGVQILAETAENGGVMKVRVPFYVSNSVARIQGFDKPIYFPGSILGETTSKGQAKIAGKSPGLTSYARHSQATSKTELPCGDVLTLEMQGTRGYATIAVNSTRWGQDIQALARANQLRAVSLRTSVGGYGVVERKVNGELMLEATSLDLDGIDFAPDGAAMPTYGVEVLAAEAAVEEPAQVVPRRNKTMEDITVDGLRVENPQVVAQIEAPLKAEIATLNEKVDGLIQAEAVRRRDALVAEIAGKIRKPLEDVQALFAEAKTEDEVARLALPVLLETTATPEKPEKTQADRLREMFATSGRGQSIQAEVTTPEVEVPNIKGFAVPSN